MSEEWWDGMGAILIVIYILGILEIILDIYIDWLLCIDLRVKKITADKQNYKHTKNPAQVPYTLSTPSQS